MRGSLDPHSKSKISLSIYVKLLITVTVWGMSFVATKVLIPHVEPISVVFSRVFIGVLVLILVLKKRRFSLKVPRKSFIWLFFFGFMAVFMHQWVQAYALYTSKASTATWIVTTAPVFIAILGRLLLKEKLSYIRILGIFMSFFGVLLVVTEGKLASAFSNSWESTGNIIILLTSVNWALFSVISRFFLQKNRNIPQLVVIFYIMLFGFLLSGTAFFLKECMKDIIIILQDSRLVSAVLFLGILSTGFAYAFWYDALDVLEASKVGVFMYIQPLVGMVTAFMILGEPISLFLLIGGGLILTGVYLVNRF